MKLGAGNKAADPPKQQRKADMSICFFCVITRALTKNPPPDETRRRVGVTP